MGREDRRPLRVLAVDDSAVMRGVLKTVFDLHARNEDSPLPRMELCGLVRDGVEALEAVRTLSPDVLLLDLEMPRMNGFECLKAIRQDSQLKHLPVIMITSRTAAKHRQRAQDLGIHGYLGKPFQEEELARLLQESVATS